MVNTVSKNFCVFDLYRLCLSTMHRLKDGWIEIQAANIVSQLNDATESAECDSRWLTKLVTG